MHPHPAILWWLWCRHWICNWGSHQWRGRRQSTWTWPSRPWPCPCSSPLGGLEKCQLTQGLSGHSTWPETLDHGPTGCWTLLWSIQPICGLSNSKGTWNFQLSIKERHFPPGGLEGDFQERFNRMVCHLVHIEDPTCGTLGNGEYIVENGESIVENSPVPVAMQSPLFLVLNCCCWSTFSQKYQSEEIPLLRRIKCHLQLQIGNSTGKRFSNENFI